MKKFLFIITCFCSILTISCASKKAQETTEIFESPAIDFEQDDTAQTDSENQNENEQDKKFNNIEYSDISSDDFETQDSPQMEIIGKEEILLETEQENEDDILPADEILQEIEEPEIITLEPKLEEVFDNSEKQDEQTELDDSILEVNVTDVEIQDDNQSENEENSDTLQEENQQEQDDDIILVIESDDSTIDITNDDVIQPVEEEVSVDPDEQTESAEEKIIPSRKVTLKKMEYLDISYPGRGWIYMGITDGSKDLSYFGRKLGTSDTNFTFQAKTEGTKILHFTKNDTLQNEYIDDYIEVEILSEKGSNKTHIKAPEFKQVSKKQIESVDTNSTEVSANTADNLQQTNTLSASSSENKSSETPKIETESEDKKTKPSAETNNSKEKDFLVSDSNDDSVSDTSSIEEKENFDPKTLLKEAKLLYNEKEYTFALEKIETVLERSDIGKDEALYLQGQCYEAKSEIQNIKKALNSYTLLVENFPASKYWDNANKRIIYLKRFYLEAR